MNKNNDTTMNTGRATTPDAAPDDGHPAGGGRSGLNPAQVTASALAAATSTFALSYFGVVGTIAGAALGSVVTVVGNDVYLRSIRRTTETVNKIAPVVVPVRDTGRRTATRPLPPVPGPPPPPPGAVGREPATEQTAVAAAGTEPADETARPGPLGRLIARYGRTKVLVGASAVLFLVIMAAVLLLEVGTGKPLSDTVRGRDGSGTTLFDTGGSGGGADPTESPSPSTEPGESSTPDPGEDDGDTSTSEPTPTPSESPSEEPSESPSEESSAEPSPTPTEPAEPDESAPEPEAPQDVEPEQEQPPADDGAAGDPGQ